MGNLAGALALAIGYLSLGLLAALRHAAAALVLRPRWDEISDSRHSLLWFLCLALAAGMLRWSVLGPLPAGQALLHLGIYFALPVLLFAARGRSRAVVLMCWATSTAVDLVACTALAAGITVNEGPARLLAGAWELFSWHLLDASFKRTPPHVQRAGYRPGGGGTNTAGASRAGGERT